MSVDVYVQCLIDQFLYRIISILQNSLLLEYCLILKNKNLASIEKSRLKYFSKKCGNQIWILSILDISKVALRWCKSACVQQLLLKIYERKFFFRTVIYILGERLLLNIRKGHVYNAVCDKISLISTPAYFKVY